MSTQIQTQMHKNTYTHTQTQRQMKTCAITLLLWHTHFNTIKRNICTSLPSVSICLPYQHNTLSVCVCVCVCVCVVSKLYNLWADHTVRWGKPLCNLDSSRWAVGVGGWAYCYHEARQTPNYISFQHGQRHPDWSFCHPQHKRIAS